MKYLISLWILVIVILTGCSNETDVSTDVIKSVNNDNITGDQQDDEKIDLNKDQQDDDTIISDEINSFIGDWKVKAIFEDDFFITEELSCQDNGIGIYKDHMIIYASEVNDYINCKYDIIEVNDISMLIRITERETLMGRKRKDNTKLFLSLDGENSDIMKCTYTYETAEGNYNNTYIYQKDQQGILSNYYLSKQKSNTNIDDAALDSISNEIQNEWFKDYDDVRENEFLRFNDYSGIKSYEIKDGSILSKHYDLEGNLSWKSGEEAYIINSITDDTVVLEVVSEQGKQGNIIGLYYLIQLQGKKAVIKKYDYLSNNMYQFHNEKVVKDSLESVLALVSNKNNLSAFDEEQVEFFNKIIGKWGTMKDKIYDEYIYNLIIDNYCIDFYEYATGFMEAINYEVQEINVDEKEVIINVIQYSWWDEVNSETKYIDNTIKINLNDEGTKLTFNIQHNKKDKDIFFDMGKDYIGEVQFEKILD
ncbi:hypothetical protein [Vallitalea guaymasensis]|uniref:Uncharacterized protein n=2 Tax=Vallitalea guaymasensis TaxID=1185412 RepID=A0A8J8MEI8_9FIRM|nr:hypothetical protein [Vallitalea guaymasensis]QUH31175.1 hypothetical protein HYG85_20515 [Vallitalea guaymasensis]